MVIKIRVSRQGLTRCPACRAHIKVAADVTETECPFCEEHLLAERETVVQGAMRAASKALMTGRSSLIAASLFGATAVIGCSSDASDTTDASGAASGEVDVTEAPEPFPETDYGGSGLDLTDGLDGTDTADDTDGVDGTDLTDGTDTPDAGGAVGTDMDTDEPDAGSADGTDEDDASAPDVIVEDAPEPDPEQDYGGAGMDADDSADATE